MARFEAHPARRPAIVTGASSGIGAAIAQALSANGHPVVLGARRLQRCEQLAESIRAGGGEAFALFLDLADPNTIGPFFADATARAGDIEVLVSCAGEISPAPALAMPDGAFSTTVQVNTLGAVQLASAVATAMVQRRRGDVVFVTSDTVRRPRPYMAAYSASKWALEGYARTLQMELEGTGVRASIVQPGPTHSEMGTDWGHELTADVLEAWVHWGQARHDHFMRPQEVASAVVTVVSARRGTHFTLIEVNPEAPVTKGDT